MLTVDEISQMLELIERPAFCVAEGAILCANQAAQDRSIQPGTPVRDLLRTSADVYGDFSQGSLYLTIQVDGLSIGASVVRIGGLDIFTLDPEDADPALRAYALAATALRQPLQDIMTLAGELPQSERTPLLNRGLHQLLRLVENMSQSSATLRSPETRDVTAVMQELFERAAVLCGSAGVELRFRNHPVSVYSIVDSDLLERCVYAILSNSLKYASPGDVIEASLIRRKNTLYLTIQDPGRLDPSIHGRVFDRFRRPPSAEDARHGIGLGLKLAQTVALAHEGSLWVDEPSSGGVRVMLALPIRQSSSLRSPVRRLQYSKDWDTALVELSEVLPPQWYAK